MFGHKSLPSRIYSYGANPPIENADLVEKQMLLAGHYRNALVESELARRVKVEEVLHELSPELISVDAEVAKAEQEVEALRDEMRSEHSALMQKVHDPEKAEKAKEIKKTLKDLWAKQKALRTALFASLQWKTRQEEIDSWVLENDKGLRAKSELYWGTYLHVEQSMSDRRKGAPPRFKRLDGGGHLAVQIQHGMTAQEALTGADSRLSMKLGPVEVDGSRTHLTGIKRKLGNALCRFRVGSDEKGKPIFALVPFTMHRPIPDGAMIKWVHLVRRRIGTKFEWKLQFVLSQEQWERDWAKSGSVDLSFGWSMTDCGSLRVARWSGSDGRSGELLLPADWLFEMDRVERIQSYRDKNLEGIKKYLAEWLKSQPKSWLHEQTENLSQWRSAGRFAGLIIRWRDARIQGDGEAFTIAEMWRQRDKHLYEFEAHLRDQLQNRREYLYREFAARLSREYKTARIPNLNLKECRELPAVEEKQQHPAVREHQGDACISLLKRCLKEAMKRTAEPIKKGNQGRPVVIV